MIQPIISQCVAQCISRPPQGFLKLKHLVSDCKPMGLQRLACYAYVILVILAMVGLIMAEARSYGFVRLIVLGYAELTGPAAGLWRLHPDSAGDP